ncbi:putative cation transporting ATPase, partial [Aureobasidium melanogenum]
MNRDRRSRLVETLHHGTLLLIDILHLGLSEVLGDLFKVFFSSVEESNTDVGLLECTNIVCTITSHQSNVPSISKTKQNLFLLLGRNTSVDPSVADDFLESLLTSKLRESVTGNTKILGFDNLGVDGLSRVDRNADFVVNASPDKVFARIVMFGCVKNQSLAVDNLNLSSNVNSRKRVVASDHDTTVTTLVQHTNCLDSIILERTLQHEETSELEVTLSLFALHVVNLVLTNLVASRDEFYLKVSSYLGGTSTSMFLMVSGAPLTPTKVLLVFFPESRCVVTTVSNRLTSALCGNSSLASQSIVASDSPAKRCESSFLHRLTNDVSILEFDKSMSWVRVASAHRRPQRARLPGQESGLQHHQRQGLLRERNTEGFCAEDGILAEGSKRGIDSQTQFHRQLRGHNASDNKDTVQKELGALSILGDTLGPDIPRSSNSKDSEEKNEEQGFNIVG